MDMSALSKLLPQTASTNTGSKSADMMAQEATFQAALDEATSKIDNATKKNVKVMTQDEINERNKGIREASVELEAIL